jgi:hypothetical protein
MAARQLALALMGCALVLAGAHAAEVGPTAPRPHTVRPVGLHPGVAVAHPQPIHRSLPGGQSIAGRAATNAIAARSGKQPLALRPGANRLTTARTAMARSAVVGGPRTQERGTLGGPVNSRSAIRGGIGQGGIGQGGISGTALRRRF